MSDSNHGHNEPGNDDAVKRRPARREPAPPATPRLEREEYVEQAHWFRLLGERLLQNRPLQELLSHVRDELLATTKLPLAVDFLRGELEHLGTIWQGMRRLRHYFTPFQTYVIREAEDEGGRFDFLLAVDILREEATARSNGIGPQALFMYQFESLCRNRLRYDPGLEAMAEDPWFDESWRAWILTVRRQVGIVDFADLVYVRSDFYRGPREPSQPALFAEREGRIAWANRRKDPLYLFAALQRQLGYPVVPRPRVRDTSADQLVQALRRLERLEVRMKMMEEEQRTGAADLSRFMKPGGG